MNIIKFTKHCLFLLSGALLTQSAIAEESISSFVEAVEKGGIITQQENRSREESFLTLKNERNTLLVTEQNNQKLLENVSETLEKTFEENDIAIDNAKIALDKRLGSLKELFGVVQGASADFSTGLEFSLTNVEYPNRQEFLADLGTKMAKSSSLPSMAELENFWQLMDQELKETGQIKAIESQVTLADGTKMNKSIIRVGTFNAISDGKYLSYIPQTNSFIELPRQPKSSYLTMAQEFGSQKVSSLAVDPTGATGGSLLLALMDAPSLEERVHQGGVVGYSILAIGLIGLLFSLERMISLTTLSASIKKQLANVKDANDKNPLGRVLGAYKQHKTEDLEAVELKMHEAVLKEVPQFTKNLGFIKMISMVAPLMGLLGTVTGMIITFQAITLFGTGDPKTMAGGISSALMTTVLGLVVAIPTLLLHNLLNTKAKNQVAILEQQATGLVAMHAQEKAEQKEESETLAPNQNIHVA